MALSTNTSKINDILETINNLPDAPSGNKNIIASTSTQTNINVYDYATVSVVPTPAQSKTLILGAAAPTTIIPDSGKVLSSVPVTLDTNVIKAENIAKDVQILGVMGTCTGGGSAGSSINILTAAEMEAVLAEENVGKAYRFLGTTDETYVNGDIYEVEALFGTQEYKFIRYAAEEDPLAYFIEGKFSTYENDTIKTIGTYAFKNCNNLTTVSFPACTSIASYAFTNCNALTTVSFPACTAIGSKAFWYCYNLLSLYLMGSQYITLSASDAFDSTPISKYTTSTHGVYGSIYVPASMLASYKTAANWSYFSSRFVGV